MGANQAKSENAVEKRFALAVVCDCLKFDLSTSVAFSVSMLLAESIRRRRNVKRCSVFAVEVD